MSIFIYLILGLVVASLEARQDRRNGEKFNWSWYFVLMWIWPLGIIFHCYDDEIHVPKPPKPDKTQEEHW